MTVIEQIAAERQRQIEVEGWTAEHDDEHRLRELALAAMAYCETACGVDPCSHVRPYYWPFSAAWWKPKGRRRNLVRAAALIVAEIERLDRAAGHQRTEQMMSPFVKTDEGGGP